MEHRLGKVGIRAAAVGVLVVGVGVGVTVGHRPGQQIQLQDEAQEQLVLQQKQIAATQAARAQAATVAKAEAVVAAQAESDNATKLDKAVTAQKAQEAAAAKAAEEEKQKEEQEAAAKAKEEEEASTPVGGYDGPIPSSCSDYSGNRAIGCALLLDDGFAISQMPCLDDLFNQESGWNQLAENQSSGAYGIPQALPGSKMASAGSDWQTSAATQIKWGLSYIKGRYSTPCAAWQNEEDNGSY